MSDEVFELVKKLNIRDIGTQMVLQCAPLIADLKTSNLLTIQKENIGLLEKIICGTKISCYRLLEDSERVTVLLYRESALREYVREAECQAFLRQAGYTKTSLHDILPEFQQKYENYMRSRKEFPHEMGILLGYPVEDVDGFVRFHGEGFIGTGYWKVYGSLEEKQRLFRKYDLVKDTMITLISQGMNIKDIIEVYASNGMALEHVS